MKNKLRYSFLVLLAGGTCAYATTPDINTAMRAPNVSLGAFPGIPIESTDPVKALPELLEFQRLPETHDLVSNSPTFAQAKPILEGASEGIYITVGGFDRAARGLELATRATHLLLVDYDPYVVMYNAINVGLLKASKSREDYRKLRMTSKLNEWKSRATALDVTKELGGLFALQAKSERTPNSVNSDPLARAHAWWVKWVRQPDSFDDALFKRVRKMAKDGKIAVTRIDLRDGDAVKDLTSRFRGAGIPVSVVDLSNAWWPNYIASEKIEALLRSLGASAQTGSRVLLAGGTDPYGYTGYSIKNLLNRPSLRDFFLQLQEKPDVFSTPNKVAVYQP